MRTDYLSPEIYNQLYSIMTYDNVLALRVSLETGLRIDDVLSLRVEQLQGRTLRGVAEKTDKPYRKVISRELADRLRRLHDEGYFFPHRLRPKEEHRTRQAVWANMKKAARILNVQLNAAPHSARKTYAVDVLREGGIEKVQRELQHDRITTTMLYAFSNLLTANTAKNDNFQGVSIDIDAFADKIAEKVVERLRRK